MTDVRGHIQWVRGMCTDEAPHVAIDWELGRVLDALDEKPAPRPRGGQPVCIQADRDHVAQPSNGWAVWYLGDTHYAWIAFSGEHTNRGFASTQAEAVADAKHGRDMAVLATRNDAIDARQAAIDRRLGNTKGWW